MNKEGRRKRTETATAAHGGGDSEGKRILAGDETTADNAPTRGEEGAFGAASLGEAFADDELLQQVNASFGDDVAYTGD